MRVKKQDQEIGAVAVDTFEAFRTQVSLPFKPGQKRRVQIKVIDTGGPSVLKTLGIGTGDEQ